MQCRLYKTHVSALHQSASVSKGSISSGVLMKKRAIESHAGCNQLCSSPNVCSYNTCLVYFSMRLLLEIGLLQLALVVLTILTPQLW